MNKIRDFGGIWDFRFSRVVIPLNFCATLNISHFRAPSNFQFCAAASVRICATFLGSTQLCLSAMVLRGLDSIGLLGCYCRCIRPDVRLGALVHALSFRITIH